MGSPNTLLIADFPVRVTTQTELTSVLLAALATEQKTTLFFANTNFIVKCRSLLSRMRDPSVIIANDGIGLDLAALLVYRCRFQENLNGTDFTPFLFRHSPTPLRVYMVGAKPTVLAKAAGHVRTHLGQHVVGTCDGYGGIKNNPALVADINLARPDVILVALGNPIQEEWILDHRRELDAGVVIGVGALFDFWAGEKPRAPRLVQRLRLEWLYRLVLEPRRLLRRYTVDILIFFMHCYRHRQLPGPGG